MEAEGTVEDRWAEAKGGGRAGGDEVMEAGEADPA